MRAGRVYAVPLALVVHVIEGARLAPVPLTPPSHRGLLYHGRALHPVLDLAAWYGAPDPGTARTVLLLDAGGAGVGVLADRVLPAGEGEDPIRPPWDAIFTG